MFYSQFILAKKGPLANIWIAAHLERKLRRSQIAETNISDSVDFILYPELPIALRLSGHLLLGVVRIYSRKVNLLFNDCNEALTKILKTFQKITVDLPPGAVIAPYHSITLPGSFDLDNLEPYLSRENSFETQHHVSSRDLITLKDQQDDKQPLFSLDERFEDYGNPYALFDVSMEDEPPHYESANVDETHLNVEESIQQDVLPPMQMEGDFIVPNRSDHHTSDTADHLEEVNSLQSLNGGDTHLNIEDDCVVPDGSEHQTLDSAVHFEEVASFQSLNDDDTHLNIEVLIPLDVLPPMSTEDDCTDIEGTEKGMENEISDMNNNICVEKAFDEMPSENLQDITMEDVIAEKSESTINVPEIEKLRAVGEGSERHVQQFAIEESDTERDTSANMDMDQHESFQNTGSSEYMQKVKESPLESEPVLSQVEMHTTSSSTPNIDDNDTLGRILRNRTPKINVAPTPEPVKRRGRKRKHPFDDITTLPSSFMKKQLKSTHDICRERRKGPCTEYEIWMAGNVDYHEKKLFSPSTPGLCEVMTDIFTDVINLRFDEEISSTQRKRKVRRALVFETPEGVNHRHSTMEGEDNNRTKPEAINFSMDEGIPNRVVSEPAEITSTGQVVEGTCKLLHEQNLHEDPSTVQIQQEEPAGSGQIVEGTSKLLHGQISHQEPFADVQVHHEELPSTGEIAEGTSKCLIGQIAHEVPSKVVQVQSEEPPEDVQIQCEELQINYQEASVQIQSEKPCADAHIEQEDSSTGAQTHREESSALAKSQHEESSMVDQTQHCESSSAVDNEIQYETCPHKSIKLQQSTMSLADENGITDPTGQDNGVLATNSYDDPQEHEEHEGLEFLAESGDADMIAVKTVNDPKVDNSSFDHNSGWSSRTRAVAAYFKTKFESMEVPENSSKQDQHLRLENLLTGRTRREAARMFFETLVLETKGYLQVGDESSFGDIHLKPSRRLMKAVF